MELQHREKGPDQEAHWLSWLDADCHPSRALVQHQLPVPDTGSLTEPPLLRNSEPPYPVVLEPPCQRLPHLRQLQPRVFQQLELPRCEPLEVRPEEVRHRELGASLRLPNVLRQPKLLEPEGWEAAALPLELEQWPQQLP